MCYDCVGVKGIKYGAAFFTHNFPGWMEAGGRAGGGERENGDFYTLLIFLRQRAGRSPHTATY